MSSGKQVEMQYNDTVPPLIRTGPWTTGRNQRPTCPSSSHLLLRRTGRTSSRTLPINGGLEFAPSLSRNGLGGYEIQTTLAGTCNSFISVIVMVLLLIFHGDGLLV